MQSPLNRVVARQQGYFMSRGSLTSKVAPTTAQCPQKIRLTRGPDLTSIAQDNLHVKHVLRVGRKPEFCTNPADTPTQS